MQSALDIAKFETVHLGQVSQEEAHEISEYIKRDINDAAEHMMEASAEFYDWLMLDIEVIERKVMELFLSVADHTRLELEKFTDNNSHIEQQQRKQIPLFSSGEIATPGTLICENCGKTRPYFTAIKIIDCKRCGHQRFIQRHQHDL